MKKLVLSMIGAVAMLTVNAAAPETTAVWNNTIASVAAAEDVNYSSPMAITATGETYVAGIVSGDGFTFANNNVTPVGVSSYLALYRADGTPAWAVTFAGATTVTAITTDAEGNVYVAGKLADVVTFGSTDGKTIEKAGAKDEYDTYTTDQKAGFIAKYDLNGVLKAVNTFVPAILPDVKTAMDLAMSTMLFYYYENYASFNIKNIEVVGDKLIVGATYGGSTTIGEVEFKGAYQNVEGWMFVDLANGAVFSLDTATLSTAEVLFSSNVTGGLTDNGASTTTVAFDVNDGVLYSVAIVSGAQDITIGTTTESKEFSISDDGVVEYATVVAAINLDAKAAKASKVYTISTNNTNKDEIEKVIANGENVYVGGLAHTALAFDNTKEVKAHGDIFATSLKAADLSVEWTALSGVEEGTGTDNGEVFVGMGILGNDLVLTGYTENLSDRTPIEGVNAYVAKVDGTLTITDDKTVNSAVATNGTLLGTATYEIAGEVANVTYKVAKIAGSAICNVEVDADANATAKYYNMQGVEVTGENMPAGIYVCKQGNKAVKVLVK